MSSGRVFGSGQIRSMLDRLQTGEFRKRSPGRGLMVVTNHQGIPFERVWAGMSMTVG